MSPTAAAPPPLPDDPASPPPDGRPGPAPAADAGVRFREEQRFTQVWLWAVVAAATVVVWVALGAEVLASEPGGSRWVAVVVLVVVGICVPLLVALARLRVEVHEDRVEVRYRPFVARTIDLDAVVGAEAVTYRPLRDYGGWGIKGWSRRKIAYNVRGNRGALLTLADGRTVLIGSQRAEDLAAAVRQGLPART